MSQAPTTADQRAAFVSHVLEKHGITFADCVGHFGDNDANPYVRAAREKQIDGELEFDDTPVVSGSDDGGDYVMAWVWVSNEEAGIEDDDDDEDDYNVGDDLCDTCMRSGVVVARTDEDGNTVCVDCDEEEDD